MNSRPIQVELRGIHKRYGATEVVVGVDLQVEQGSFFSILGPSGCGKSTLLRIIAGFETPSAGEVFIAGRNMRGIPPEKREIGIVFQNYALFPHMSVADNIAFGLQARRMRPALIARQVERMLDLVELSGLGGRRPGQLSGGQQQRIALARALAIEPQLLLLDEPLGALDRKLRESMQTKLMEVQRTLGVTAIFVTHDQEEALTMSDRLAVMNARLHRIEQIGTPEEIYARPSSLHVSKFIGRSNLWQDQVDAMSSSRVVLTRRGFRALAAPGLAVRGDAMLTVRPERICMIRSTMTPSVGDALGRANRAAGVVRQTIFAGGVRSTMVETLEGDMLEVRELNSEGRDPPQLGEPVELSWSETAMLAFPPSSSS